MDDGCYAIDCLRLLGGDVPSVTGALADPRPPFPVADPRRWRTARWPPG